MKLKEALQALCDGKKIRRPTWPREQYVHLVDGELCTQSGTMFLFWGDVRMWELYKEPKKYITMQAALTALEAGETVRWEHPDSYDHRTAPMTISAGKKGDYFYRSGSGKNWIPLASISTDMFLPYWEVVEEE